MNQFPAIFVSHGAPTLLIQDSPAHHFLRQWGQQLQTDAGGKPRAIVVVSAHWQSAEVQVSSQLAPELIYDFYGFPEELYSIRYQPPGDPQLADKILQLLAAADIPAQANHRRGLDHGVWVPLALMFPEADIPVVQISLPREVQGQQTLAIGKALASLRDDGVLLVGSGAITHNLRALNWQLDAPADSRLDLFRDWLKPVLEQGDIETLLNWYEEAPAAHYHHPTTEHFLPLFFVAGAVLDHARTVHQSEEYAVLAMDMWEFTH